MTKKAADVFKLQLVRSAEDSVLVLASHPSCGDRRHTMTPPFSKRALQGLLNLLETRLHTSITVEGPEAEALHTLGLLHDGQLPCEEALLHATGVRLFAALFPPSQMQDEDVRGGLEIALNQARQAGQALPFQLRFDSHAVDLAALPWELMRDESGPLVASGRVRFSRYITFGKSTKRYPVVDRLSVLVVAPRPSQVARLDASLESQAIRRALDVLYQRSLIHVDVLDDPTFAGLARAVNHHPYHILHFDGHGGYVVRCPTCDRLQPASRATCEHCRQPLADAQSQGCLVFEGEESGRLHYVRAEELAVALAESQIRLCVISACQSTTLKGASVFNSVGPKLIEAGTPAVIGMQFTVLSNHAARFVEEFYSGLAQQKSVVAAADAARRLLYAEGVWYVPTTYLRSKDGEGNLFRFHERAHGLRQRFFAVDAQGTGVYLLPAGLALPDWSQMVTRNACPYRRLRPFALQDKALFFGRIAEVAALLAAVIAADRRFAVLLGAAGVGKTSLLHAGLIPELLRHSYLTLTVCGDGDPVAKVRKTLASSCQIGVDLSAVTDLPSLVDALVHDLDRPLLIAWDDFDEYLAHTAPADVDAFVEKFAQCVDRPYPLPIRFLFVLREDHQSQLSVFQRRVPTIFDNPVFLHSLSPQAAEQAMTQPLAVCKLPVAYDAGFLTKTLLPELSASPTDGVDDSKQAAVNPTFLQIVADDLLQAALHTLPSLQQGTTFVIGEDFYNRRRTATILNSYLDQKLSEHFPDAAELQRARSLLKQMVTPDGDRRFQPKTQMVACVGVEEAQAEEILSMLEGDGLLELRTASGGAVEYSIGHRFLAQQIRIWFDPQEALRQSAQDVLNQAWHAWRARWQLAQQQAQAPSVDVQELLLGAEHLRDIRCTQEQAAAAGQAQLAINPVHSCLLLRSAVHHRVDMGYWAQAIHNDPETVKTLAQIDGGVADLSAAEDVALCRAALGLSSHSPSSNDLARAAVNEANGDVRHTAALALAALGLQAVADALPRLHTAAPRGRFWRPTQALAQIRAGGFALPELALTRQWMVILWATFIGAWDNRWQMLVEGAPAGLGAGAGLFLAMMSIGLAQADANSARMYLLLGLFALPLGFVTGIFAVAGAWLCDLGGRTRSRLRRVAGFSTGFTASIIVAWMPVAVATALLSGRFAELAQSILMRHVVGGFFWGLGIAVGALLFGALFQHSLFWKVVMGGVGGAVTCLLATAWGVDIPFLPVAGAQSSLWSRPYLAAFLLGLWVGVGLIGGWLAGERIWQHSRQTSVRAFG